MIHEMLETKYRDIADGNMLFEQVQDFPTNLLETKYRDIADGNTLLKATDTICEPTGFLTRITNSSHNTAISIPLHSRQSS